MPLQPGSLAPYGPPTGILAVIDAVREYRIDLPITSGGLTQIGISESLIPRVLKSLGGLDLVDADGSPTEQLMAFAGVTPSERQDQLKRLVHTAYAPVFQLVAPETDDLKRVERAFLLYEPAGQRPRMVTLFLGLCHAAGIDVGDVRKPTMFPPDRADPAPPRDGGWVRNARVRAAMGDPAYVSTVKPFSTYGSVPPAVAGLLAALPPAGQGWSPKKREQFLATFVAVLDFSIPICSDQDACDDK